MSEREFDIRPIGVDYICEKCDAGVMDYTGTMFMSNPPKFEHKCNNCGDTQSFAEKYPTIRYKRIG